MDGISHSPRYGSHFIRRDHNNNSLLPPGPIYAVSPGKIIWVSERSLCSTCQIKDCDYISRYEDLSDRNNKYIVLALNMGGLLTMHTFQTEKQVSTDDTFK